MTTQDYNKSSDRLQAFSRIARAEIAKQMTKGMEDIINRCKIDPVYFIENFCRIEHNGKLEKMNLTEGQKYFIKQMALFGKGKIFLRRKGISGRRH